MVMGSGKLNQDVDGLSRRPYHLQIFPEAVKAVCQAALIDREQLPLAESLLITDTGQLNPDMTEIESQELSTVNWKEKQDEHPVISKVKYLLTTGERLDSENVDIETEEVKKYLRERKSFEIRKGVLFRNTQMDGMNIRQLVLPKSMIGTIFKGLHEDIGHQGREKTSWLVKKRFYWPGMNTDMREKVGHCGRCVRSKTREHPRSELVTIKTSQPMELVCIDFLSLEKSKGNIEDILVITDHSQDERPSFSNRLMVA
ncbi:uncharacterized protein LOC133176048 [Saccostrea echinata]|uniref:uncharacterized protein LOC133176048 n=1 Tax=Saccostrea echinata TaxID=191078 RepID=UPI002A813457|nr:uncharacterized protein LOC133176048 [Saccostrea echinata]